MNNIKQINFKVDEFLLFSTLFLLPFSFRFVMPFIGIFVIISFFKFNKNPFKSDYKNYFFLLILYYFILILGLINSSDIHSAINVLKLKLLIILLPFTFFNFREFISKNRIKILSVFILGNLISSILNLILSFLKSIIIKPTSISFSCKVLEEQSFWQSISHGGNQFFYILLSHFMHPSYFALSIVLAIATLIYVKKQQNNDHSKLHFFLKKDIFFFSLIIYFSIFIFMLSSRANFIAYFGLLLFSILILKIKYKKTIILLLVLSSIILVSTNPRFSDFFKKEKYSTENKKNISLNDPRMNIWKISFGLANKNMLWGVGTGDVEQKLHDTLCENNAKTLSQHNINSHNAFLQEYLRIGIIGIIILGLLFLWLIIEAAKKKNYLLAAFILVFFVNFIFESMLDRADGIYLFGILINIAIFSDQKKDIIT